jgi:hypothetical protein
VAVAVTGGFVYRGNALGTALRGAYIFSDVYSGQLHVIDAPYVHATFAPFAVTNTFEHPDEPSAGSLPRFRTIPNLSQPALVSFAEDETAELYAITFGDGKGQAIFRLAPGDLIFTDGFEP